MNLHTLRQLLRSVRGAFDLPSILVGVVVVGVLTAGVLAAVFGVIPWAQDEQAKGDLAAVRTAEGTHGTKDNRFVDLAGLQSARYLPQTTERLSVEADTAGSCYLGVAKSQSGKVFYSTDKANEPRLMSPATAATPGTLMVPCLPASSLQKMVDKVGGYDPSVFSPIGSGEGTLTTPGVSVKLMEDEPSSVTPVEPNADVDTTGVTVVERNLEVSFQNTSPSSTTIRYSGRITCYDPSRNAATVEDVDGYFDLNANIFADMTLVACTPGTRVIDVEFRPYDISYTGTGFTGGVFRWRAPVQYSQATWVSRGLTASYDGNWCIENDNNAATAGNPVKLAQCAAVDAQRWQWNGDGEIRQSSLDHKCAAASAGLLVLSDCATGAGQDFTAAIFQGNNSTGGLVQIIHKLTGQCVDVPGGALAPVQLGLAACNGAGTQSWYMPGLAASLDPALQQPQPGSTTPAAPANLTATAYPATTANFKWDATSGATGYRVEYRINGGAWTLKEETQTANTASVNGSPNDTVELRVTAKNTAGESLASTGSFQLPGETILNGSFENSLTSWTSAGAAYQVGGGRSGAYSAALGVEGSDSSLTQTFLVPSEGTSTLSFWYQPAQSEQRIDLDWTEAQIRDSSGAVLKQIFRNNNLSSTWANVTVDLTPYRGQAVAAWFNVHNDSSVLTRTRFDDVVVTNSLATAPAAPVDVFATRSGDSAAVSWKQGSDGGSTVTSSTLTPYVDGVAKTPIVVAGNATSTTVSGLTGGTYYAFTVTATNTIGVSPESASTTPFKNGDFENGLAAWTTGGNKTAIAQTVYGNVLGRNGTATVTLGNQVTSDSSISQAVQVPESGASTLSFWYSPRSTEWACMCDWTEAEIRDASGALLTPIFKGNANDTGWLKQTVDLTPYNGQTVTLWINVHNDSSNLSYTLVDDVTIASGPAVMATVPDDVTAVRTGDTAEVSWKQFSDGGSWVTSYTVTPSANGVSQAPITVSGSPAARSVTVPGLAYGTSYSFTVTATNAVGTSGPSLPSTTVLNGSFESGLASWQTGGGKAPAVQLIGRTGTKSIFLGNQLSSDSNISQTIEVPATGTTNVSFWYQPHSGEAGCGCDYTELQIKDAVTGATLETAFRSNGDTTSWLNVSRDLSAYKGKKITLWFNMHNDSSILSYSYLDDVRVTTTG